MKPLFLQSLKVIPLLAGCITHASAANQQITATSLGAPLTESPAPRLSLDSLQKPAWLTDLSLNLKESYDDNIYLAGNGQPTSFTVPAGSVAALENRASWVTTVSPKLGVNLAPLFGDQKVLQALSFAYAPDFAIYHDQPIESYDAHRFTTAIKAKADAFSFNLDNGFTYIHGSQVAPFYPGAFYSAWGIVAPRERREQIQDRAAVSLQYDQENWFIRPAASLLYYDLMTEQQNIPGYLNFSDRYDVNGGADFGYKVEPQLALTLGYRYGHQYQEQFSFTPYSSSSDYQRVLVGLEGKPWKWLDIKFQGGPDFRSYAGTTPVNNLHPVTYYGEGTFAATLTDKDALAFKYKQFRWVSCLGKVPYIDSQYDLSYHRKLTSQLGLDLGAKLLSADYSIGNLPSCQRDDLQYTVSAGVNYTFNTHISANLAYSRDMGRNTQDGVVNQQTREYDRDLVSLGAILKF